MDPKGMTVEACTQALCWDYMQVSETQPRYSQGRGAREVAAESNYSPLSSLADGGQVLRVRNNLRGMRGGLRQLRFQCEFDSPIELQFAPHGWQRWRLPCGPALTPGAPAFAAHAAGTAFAVVRRPLGRVEILGLAGLACCRTSSLVSGAPAPYVESMAFGPWLRLRSWGKLGCKQGLGRKPQRPAAGLTWLGLLPPDEWDL